jgi:serine O-acetyltransferase
VKEVRDVSTLTESIANHLIAKRDQNDPVSVARRQACPDTARVVDVLENLRAIVLEQTPHERLNSDLEVVHGLLSGLIGSDLASKFLEHLPDIRHCVGMDVEAAFKGDPAAKSYAEVIAAYPSAYAVSTYRIAHVLYELGAPVAARIMSEHAKSKTGMDIHPGASIGCHFFIDHGTGVVIGETAVIGNRVKMYHGVTLGAFSNKQGRLDAGKKRHPTIEDDVTIYPNATILGGDTVIGEGSVIGGNVWLHESVPAFSRVQITPPQLQVKHKDSESGSIDPSYDI